MCTCKFDIYATRHRTFDFKWAMKKESLHKDLGDKHQSWQESADVCLKCLSYRVQRRNLKIILKCSRSKLQEKITWISRFSFASLEAEIPTEKSQIFFFQIAKMKRGIGNTLIEWKTSVPSEPSRQRWYAEMYLWNPHPTLPRCSWNSKRCRLSRFRTMWKSSTSLLCFANFRLQRAHRWEKRKEVKHRNWHMRFSPFKSYLIPS